VSGPERPPDSTGGLPPLVLHCRPLPRYLWLAAAIYFLLSGTVFLARGLQGPAGDLMRTGRGVIGLLVGVCAAYYTARFCFARLILDDRGFSLHGPLGGASVSWGEIVDWRRRPPRGGPAPNILVRYGPDGRRLFVPLIYEESHALEVGLQQRGFPRY
jgi:hypothetical protein